MSGILALMGLFIAVLAGVLALDDFQDGVPSWIIWALLSLTGIAMFVLQIKS